MIKNNRRAIVDLGSNTFHVLIAEIKPTLTFLRKERFYVHLGEGGLGTIKQSAIDRALVALNKINLIISEYDVISVQCFGTAALRSAQNGTQFVSLVKEKLGLDINIIDGKQEAELIYQGVAALNPFHQDTGLIMDIGGGSVEFIIADKQGLKWSHSYNAGILVLFNKYHRSDPMSESSLSELKAHLLSEFSELSEQLLKYNPSLLIGASGTFDVLRDAQQSDDLLADVPISFVDNLLKEVQYLNYEERLAHHLLPEKRAQYMVEALTLVEVVLNKHSFSALCVSSFALKEGALLSC